MRPRVAHQERAEDLAAELSRLPGLSRDALCARFRGLYEITPASHLSRKLLVYAVAYRLQEQMYGGLDASTRRRLARAAEEIRVGRAPSMPAIRIKAGTRLLREWQGVVHEVIVLERGVQYLGKAWPSLSAVAREITRTRWSGPLFFGLKGRSRERS